MDQAQIKLEQRGATSQNENMMLLEIISENLIKEITNLLESIQIYKSTLSSFAFKEYAVKKDYLSILVGLKNLDQHTIRDLKEKIVIFIYI